MLGARVRLSEGGLLPLLPLKGEIEKTRVLPPISVILYRDSPIENSSFKTDSRLGQDNKKNSILIKCPLNITLLNHTQPL